MEWSSGLFPDKLDLRSAFLYINNRNRVVGCHLRKKRKTKICRFLYENIRSGFFVEEKMSRITIVHLNEKFFEEHAQHVEILKKPKRPHLVLILKIAQGTFAIPFRTSAHRPKTGRISH